MREATRNLCLVLHKDLRAELRSPCAALTMVLTGIVVAVIFSLQSELSAASKQQLIGGWAWMAVFLAGIPMLDRSFAAERENGCWRALRLAPVAPATIYLAKLAANVAALAMLECLVIPLFFVLSSVSLGSGAVWLVPVALLSGVALAAVGTAVGAAVNCVGNVRRGGGALVVLVLPLAIPVLMAAAECTRLVVAGNVGGSFWRWLQLIAAFDVVYVTAGAMLFETVIEE